MKIRLGVFGGARFVSISLLLYSSVAFGEAKVVSIPFLKFQLVVFVGRGWLGE